MRVEPCRGHCCSGGAEPGILNERTLLPPVFLWKWDLWLTPDSPPPACPSLDTGLFLLWDEFKYASPRPLNSYLPANIFVFRGKMWPFSGYCEKTGHETGLALWGKEKVTAIAVFLKATAATTLWLVFLGKQCSFWRSSIALLVRWTADRVRPNRGG